MTSFAVVSPIGRLGIPVETDRFGISVEARCFGVSVKTRRFGVSVEAGRFDIPVETGRSGNSVPRSLVSRTDDSGVEAAAS
jgi:hypothetical protein